MSGAISLPNNEIAPKGGVEVHVVLNPENNGSYKYTNVIIPAGSNSINYLFAIRPSSASNSYFVQYFIYTRGTKYLGGFYCNTGTVTQYYNKTNFDVSNVNITGINIQMIKSITLSGTVSLPNNEVASSNGLLVSVYLNSNNGGYNQLDLTIPEGSNSANYSFTTEPGSYNIEYTVKTDDTKYADGFYRKEGTTSDFNSMTIINAINSDIPNLNISLLIITALPQNFDRSYLMPYGWETEAVTETAGWSITDYLNYSGNHSIKLDSSNGSSKVSARLYTTTGNGINVSTRIPSVVSFYMYHDTLHPEYDDKVQVQYSVDNGATWVNAGGEISRYSTTPGWMCHTVSVNGFDGKDVLIGILGTSVSANKIFIDDINVIREMPFTITNVTYVTKNGNVITANAKINAVTSSGTATCVVALYDNNGKFISIATSNPIIESGKSLSTSNDFIIPKRQMSYKLKFFVCDSLQILQPLAIAQTIDVIMP